MSVSFTGINNIRIFRKKPALESYIDVDKAVKDVRRCEEIKLRYTMSNDAKGKDIDEFNEAVSRGLALSGEKIKKVGEPVDMSILIKHRTFPTEEFKPAETEFVVNETLVPLNKNSDLGMYTYLAKLTRNMAKSPEMTPAQKDSLNEINEYVADEAIKFIER